MTSNTFLLTETHVKRIIKHLGLRCHRCNKKINVNTYCTSVRGGRRIPKYYHHYCYKVIND